MTSNSKTHIAPEESEQSLFTDTQTRRSPANGKGKPTAAVDIFQFLAVCREYRRIYTMDQTRIPSTTNVRISIRSVRNATIVGTRSTIQGMNLMGITKAIPRVSLSVQMF